MTEQQIIQIVQNYLQTSQYNVAAVQSHLHDGIGSTKIPPTSVTNFVPLPANNTGVIDTSGVLSSFNIGTATPPYGIIYPIPVVRGEGVGDFSAFNGGAAPLGSFISFLPPDTTIEAPQLWIQLEDATGDPTWYGVDLSTTPILPSPPTPAATVYGGYVNANGTSGTPFPSGWTSSVGTGGSVGRYTITHNLGTTNYVVTATASEIGSFTAAISSIFDISSNSFEIVWYTPNGSTSWTPTDQAFDFILLPTN